MDQLNYESMSRAELEMKLRELQFAVVELNLFLDTHPDEQQALMDYNAHSLELNKAKRAFEKKYGPLMNFGHSLSSFPWKWIKSPWPWEE